MGLRLPRGIETGILIVGEGIPNWSHIASRYQVNTQSQGPQSDWKWSTTCQLFFLLLLPLFVLLLALRLASFQSLLCNHNDGPAKWPEDRMNGPAMHECQTKLECWGNDGKATMLLMKPNGHHPRSWKFVWTSEFSSSLSSDTSIVCARLSHQALSGARNGDE